MIKKNVQVKKSLSTIDKIMMTKELVEGYFVGGEYTPYYKEINDIVAFFTYCVDGIEFEYTEDEKGKKVRESVYNAVTKDSQLLDIYNSLDPNYDGTLMAQIEAINNDVSDMVEFRKQCIIHSSTPIDDKVIEILQKESRNKDAELKALQEAERLQKAQAKQIEYANKVSELMTPEETVELNRLMLKNGEYDPNEMAKIVADRYFESGRHDDNLQSVIDAKNSKIRELKKYKQEHDARNILADKK